jgi:hypothetical protein
MNLSRVVLGPGVKNETTNTRTKSWSALGVYCRACACISALLSQRLAGVQGAQAGNTITICFMGHYFKVFRMQN